MIRDTLEILGNVVYAFCLFWQYMLFLVWSLVIAVALPASANAGGYCNSCNTVYHDQVATVYPQTIIQHQSNEIFYSVGQGVRDYAVAQQNVAAAQAGQVERQIAALQTQLTTYRQQSQPVATPVQLVYAVPVQAVAATAVCPPGQQQQMPAAQAAAPQRPPGLVEARCVKCHEGPNAKKGFDITQKLTCEQAMKAIAAVTARKMPRDDAKFTDAEVAQFTAELLGVNRAAQSNDSEE